MRYSLSRSATAVYCRIHEIPLRSELLYMGDLRFLLSTLPHDLWLECHIVLCRCNSLIR